MKTMKFALIPALWLLPAVSTANHCVTNGRVNEKYAEALRRQEDAIQSYSIKIRFKSPADQAAHDQSKGKVNSDVVVSRTVEAGGDIVYRFVSGGPIADFRTGMIGQMIKEDLSSSAYLTKKQLEDLDNGFKLFPKPGPKFGQAAKLARGQLRAGEDGAQELRFRAKPEAMTYMLAAPAKLMRTTPPTEGTTDDRRAAISIGFTFVSPQGDLTVASKIFALDAETCLPKTQTGDVHKDGTGYSVDSTFDIRFRHENGVAIPVANESTGKISVMGMGDSHKVSIEFFDAEIKLK